ncbi:MAG: PQQ-binding-like beta-propeller repeat protein [bacterium]
MKLLIKTPDMWTKKDRALYLTARGVAFVAGIFVCSISILIIINFIQIKRTDPLNSKALTQLFTEHEMQPDNERIKEQIRELDLLARRAFFASHEFARSGAYLLLGGVAVLFAALKILVTLRRSLPHPAEDGTDSEETEYMSAQYAVGALGIIIVLISFLLATVFRPEFNPAKIKVPPILAHFPEPPSNTLLIKQWANFRGPGGNAIAHYTNMPATWDGEKNKGILWKSAVPQPGYSSPVVWENRLFLTGGNKKVREVYCYDTDNGTLLWKRRAEHIPGSPKKPPKVTDDTGYAAPTIATDGRCVCALFATGDVVCLDFQGSVLWGRNLGTPDNPYGHASSLIIYRNLLLIQYDHAQRSRLITCDLKTGKSVWEKEREVNTSWASPILVDTGDRKELILNASPFVISYNPEKGDELWRIKCMSGEVAPSPAYAEGIVIVVNRYARLAAIKPGKEATLIWEARGDLPDVASPLATGTYVFIASSEGVVTCFDQKKGNVLWKQEFETGFYASPVLVGDKVYLLDKEGVMKIFKADRTYIPYGHPKLGESTLCTPAFLDGRIYIRGSNSLYCIGASDEHS